MKNTHHKEISTMHTTTRFPRARTTALALLTLTWVTQAWAADTPAPAPAVKAVNVKISRQYDAQRRDFTLESQDAGRLGDNGWPEKGD